MALLSACSAVAVRNQRHPIRCERASLSFSVDPHTPADDGHVALYSVTSPSDFRCKQRVEIDGIREIDVQVPDWYAHAQAFQIRPWSRKKKPDSPDREWEKRRRGQEGSRRRRAKSLDLSGASRVRPRERPTCPSTVTRASQDYAYI